MIGLRTKREKYAIFKIIIIIILCMIYVNMVDHGCDDIILYSLLLRLSAGFRRKG